MNRTDGLRAEPTVAEDAPGGRLTDLKIELRVQRRDVLPDVRVYVLRGDEIIAERSLSSNEIRNLSRFLGPEPELNLDRTKDLRDFFAPVSQR